MARTTASRCAAVINGSSVLHLLVGLALFAAPIALAEECGFDSDGKYYDLSKLVTPAGYTVDVGEYSYRFQPCGSCNGECEAGPFETCKIRPAAPAFQVERKEGGVCNSVGRPDDFHTAKPGEVMAGGVMCGGGDFCLGYTGGSFCTGAITRNIFFFMTCVPESQAQVPNMVEEASECQYIVKWQTPYACSAGAKPMSRGTVFCIVYFCAIAVYLGGGVWYKHKKEGVELGVEAIPHIEFWRDLPNLCKEGSVYAWSLVPGPWQEKILSLKLGAQSETSNSGYANVT